MKTLFAILIFFFCSVAVASMQPTPFTLYDSNGNAIGSTLSGGQYGLNIAGTISTTTAGANATLAATQAVTTTEISIAAPANAFAATFESESLTNNNVRWGFSNSATNILSSSQGIYMEPGRSVENAPVGQGTYLHLITTGGTQNVDLQWFLIQ